MRAVMVEVGAPRSDQMTGMSEAIEQTPRVVDLLIALTQKAKAAAERPSQKSAAKSLYAEVPGATGRYTGV